MTILRQKCPALVLLALLASASEAAVVAARISGTVLTEDGKGIAASVFLHDIGSRRISGQAPYDRQSSSRSDGTFEIQGVPAGKYEFCIDAPWAAVLDPCIWANGGQQVAVTNADVPGIRLVAQAGHIVQLRVEDQDGMLNGAGKHTGDLLRASLVAETNLFRPLRLEKMDSAGRSLYAIVPANQYSSILLTSSSGSFSGGSGKVAKQTGKMQIPFRSGEKMATTALSIALSKH